MHDERWDDDGDELDVEPVYSELLQRQTTAGQLEVYFRRGTEWQRAQDAYDDAVIVMLPTEGVQDLINRITEPGQYRVVERDPATGQIVSRRTHHLRPRRGNVRAPVADDKPKAAQPSDAMTQFLNNEIARLRTESDRREDRHREERQDWRDQTQDLRKQLEAQRTSESARLDEVRRQAHSAEVRAEVADTQLASAMERIGELEATIADLRAHTDNLTSQAAELQQRARDNETSPMDMVMGLDQLVESFGKAHKVFNG